MKYRYSVQRDEIYQKLKASKKHLTAEQIHKLVPGMGLGTVYRNLGILGDMGMVMKSTFGDKSVFEVNNKEHHHLICKKCGEITNIYKPAIFKCVNCLSFVKDFEVEQAYINAFGYCAKCSKKH